MEISIDEEQWLWKFPLLKIQIVDIYFSGYKSYR